MVASGACSTFRAREPVDSRLPLPGDRQASRDSPAGPVRIEASAPLTYLSLPVYLSLLDLLRSFNQALHDDWLGRTVDPMVTLEQRRRVLELDPVWECEVYPGATAALPAPAAAEQEKTLEMSGAA